MTQISSQHFSSRAWRCLLLILEGKFRPGCPLHKISDFKFSTEVSSPPSAITDAKIFVKVYCPVNANKQSYQARVSKSRTRPSENMAINESKIKTFLVHGTFWKNERIIKL